MTSPQPVVTSLHDLDPQMANLRAHWFAWGGSHGLDAELALYRSGLPHRLLNGVLRLVERPVDEAAVDAETRLSGLPWHWWIGPDSHAGTAQALEARGYRRAGSMPVMATSLDAVPAPPHPAGLTIEHVNTRERVVDYVDAYATSFGIGPDLRDAVIETETGLPTDLGQLVRLVGRIDGRPVATSAVLISDGVAGLYWIATDPAHRGRGVGAALTAAAMRIGRDHGMAVCTLQASSQGQPVYTRLGFERVSEVVLYSPPAAP
ncbi:GNAT family N-acetyltransferase [Streptomyces sp. NPDC051976]|uniref:GNAT family N-acetyltransferase n=1 Tax=Streptomyces sp. NPDC051976 TaxID=3154947 RepID=UPI003414C447